MANYDSVENGENIINTAIQNFGRIDILINNAGILRDVSLKNMTDKDWDLIMNVHITGAYKVCIGTKRMRRKPELTCDAVLQSSMATLQKAKVWTCDQHRFGSRSLRQFRSNQLLW